MTDGFLSTGAQGGGLATRPGPRGWRLRLLHRIGRLLGVPFKVDGLPYGADVNSPAG